MQPHTLLNALLAGASLAAAAAAQTEILVTSDISVSTTWTANNVYNLQQQIYVLPGATLTIEAGTVIASTTGLGGSLAVTRGAQIHCLGTERNPVIFTSAADRATWTANDPKTGTWRAIANEWGNLTLMGNAYISENLNPATNTPAPSPTNVATMEGLTAAFPGDTRVLYGGGNDDDDSGTISYVSLRYTGRVIGLGNELNGLALGGVGRNTDVHHVDIMNGVDDGIEIWGGTVNLKHVNIWNVGDDSFDVDQGWRGRMQFGCIVQGYSAAAAQGSGWGDNAFELDGAERSDYQPVTTATIYNCTVIGCPTTPVTGGLGGTDHATAWRDNARVQFRNSIFMDIGERVVSFENDGGEGTGGYGLNGTLDWPTTWTTPFTATSTVNAPANPAAFYNVQTSGNLIEFTDNVFYNNGHSTAYTEANARGVFAAANNNVQSTLSPIVALTRGAAEVVSGANTISRVVSLNPLPANDALTPVAYAAPGGFFESARYRGAFAPGDNWLVGWTAADAYGFVAHDGWCDLGNSAAGTYGAPVLDASGTLAPAALNTFALSNARENSLAILLFGLARADISLAPAFPGVVLVPNFQTLGTLVVVTSPTGTFTQNLTLPFALTGAPFYEQYLVFDVGSPSGLAATNAVFKVAP